VRSDARTGELSKITESRRKKTVVGRPSFLDELVYVMLGRVGLSRDLKHKGYTQQCLLGLAILHNLQSEKEGGMLITEELQ